METSPFAFTQMATVYRALHDDQRAAGRVRRLLEGPRRNWLLVPSIIFLSALSSHHPRVRLESLLIDLTDADKLVQLNLMPNDRNFLVSHINRDYAEIILFHAIPTRQFVVSYTLLTNKDF